MNSKLSTPISRRGFLSAAVVVGAFVGLSSIANSSGKAYAASLEGVYGTPVEMQHFPAGKGVLRTWKNVFLGKDVSETAYFTGTDGRLKIAYAVIGGANQFQIADAQTGVREFMGTPPSMHNGVISALGWNPQDKYIYLVMAGTVVQFNISTKLFKELGQITDATTAGYGPAFDSFGNGWYGSYPDAGVGRFAVSTGARTAYPNVDPGSQYVRSITVLNDVVYCGTGVKNPSIISFPANNPMARTKIAVPNIIASDFVHKVDAHVGRVFAHYVNTSKVTKCSAYNPANNTWMDLKYNPYNRKMVSLPGDSWVYFIAKTYPEARYSIVRWNPATNVYETVCAAPSVPSSMEIRKTATGNVIDIIGENTSTSVITSYCVSLSSGTVISSAKVDVAEIPYKIQDMIASSDGKFYIGGYQGDGIGTVNIATDERWRSQASDPINQIEGMMEYGTDKIYVGSYGSADLVRFTKATASSVLMKRLATEYGQSRPFAWAAAGGKVITGTVPGYGLNGGALAIIEPSTDTVENVLNNYIPDQSIVGLTGNGDIVYGTTSVLGGLGGVPDGASATVFAYNVVTGARVWTNTSLIHEQDIYAPVIAKGRLFVGVPNGIVELDINTGSALRTWKLLSRTKKPGWRDVRLAYHAQTNRLIHSIGGTLTAVGLSNNSRSLLYQGDSVVMDISANGKIYIATGGGMDIAEIDAVYSPTIASPAEVIAISPGGGLSLRRSNGAGGYTTPFSILSSGYADAKSVHIADWNGNGIYDLVSNHTDGSLRVRYGKVEGGFEAPIVVSPSGWDTKRIAVGRWYYSTYRPAVVSINQAGDLEFRQVSSDHTLGNAVKLGSGWKAEQFGIIDRGYNKVPGLLVKEGAAMYWYPKADVMNPSSTRYAMATAGYSSATSFTVVQKHRGENNGIVWHNNLDELRYVSNLSGTFGGILNYGVTWSGYRLGGASL